MSAINFKGMFDAYTNAVEKEWRYDRNASLGASEAFGCLRKAFFRKHQYEPDDNHEQDWGAAKRGDIIENHFAVPAVQAILPPGAELIMAGDEQDTLREGRLSATLDGLIIGLERDALKELGIDDIESDCVVVEFKSFDPRATIDGAKEIHEGQTQVQMGMVHEKTKHRPEYAVIIYFNASFLSDIRTFVVKRNPRIFEAAKKRAAAVFKKDAEPEDFMAEGKISGECSLCEFTEECAYATGEATPKSSKKVTDPEILERLELLTKRHAENAAIEKSAEKDKKLAAEEIKELLRQAETKSVGEEKFRVSLAWCKGKTSLDQVALAEALREHGLKIEDYQNEGNGYERLAVKLLDTD